MDLTINDIDELTVSLKSNSKSCSSIDDPNDVEYFMYNNFLLNKNLFLFNLLISRQNLLQKIIDKNLPGSFAEIGIMKGAFSFQIMKTLLMNKIEKNFYIFDFFENEINMTNSSEKKLIDDIYRRTKYNRKSVAEFMKFSNNIGFKHLKPIKGNIEDTIPQFVNNNNSRFCFIYIDVDVEKPTLIAVKYLWERLVIGGVMVIDDYNSEKWGPFLDIDTFFKNLNVKITSLGNSIKEGIVIEKL